MPLALAVCEEGAEPSPETERRFFAKLRLPNGTWKTTYPKRLDDVNQRLLELLPEGRSLEAMDVAVSSGISTVEWSDQLLANGVRHKLVAGDIDPDGRLISWGGWLAVLFDGSGREPLLLEIGSLTLPVRSERRLARLARPLLIPSLRVFARRARPVSLVSAELRRRAEIELVRDDVTVPGRFAERFDVIRVANLLQPTYFDERTLRTIAVNLRDRLRDGGLLVICRTAEDEINRATIFRRRGDRFSSEASINGGSEVEDLVLAL
ncbi:MAG TPA: hypothetical protein VN752_01600 [Solirubrobacterales bacterium]|nr:hypothetical protein [Solirubrobacterales bacterium]